MADSLFTRRDMLGGVGAAAVGAMAPLGAARAGNGPRESARPKMSASMSRPNIVFFMPDELRADAVGCYGNPVVKTPHFDELARQGARFQNCHVQYPICTQSRCSMLTGWPTSVRGHRSMMYMLRPDEPNMFRYLIEAGYDVFWFGKNDALSQDSFTRSATYWKERPPYDRNIRSLTPGITSFLYKGGEDVRQDADYSPVHNGLQILERREADRPFCVFLALSDPHPPYRAPHGFDGMYNPDALPPLIPPGLPKKPSFHMRFRETAGLTRATDRVFREVRATYYGMISYSDWLLGQVLETLERTGRSKDTAVFMASDHGDYAGDFGLVEKWASGQEHCVTRVPLIARVPGCPSGVVAEDLIELYDIMPTILELAGTRAAHTNFARSLVPQLKGGAGDPDRAAFSEGGYNIYEPQCFEPIPPVKADPYWARHTVENKEPQTVSRVASVKTKRYNYVMRPAGISELYDLADDPQEKNNLIDESTHRHVREALHKRLLQWYVDTSGVAPKSKDARGMPPYDPMAKPVSTPGEREELLDL